MNSNNINNIIKGPILTEKSYQMMSESVYSFKVSPKTNRSETKKAIEYIFNVKVEKVNIFNVPKKAKKIGKSKGFLPAYKKAFVKLAPGFSINLFNDETPKPAEISPKDEESQLKTDQKRAEFDEKSKLIAKKVAQKFAKSTSTSQQETEVEKAETETEEIVVEAEEIKAETTNSEKGETKAEKLEKSSTKVPPRPKNSGESH